MSDPQNLNQFFPKGNHEEEILDTNISVLNSTTRHNIDEELCRTPTCRKNKIPTVGSCPPPAPKKPRNLVLSKRKFSQLEFFEVGGNEELENFFISCTEISREVPTPKRTINIQDKSEGKKAQQKKPAPAQQVDEDETQPAEEPKEMPTPPKMEAGQKAQKRKPEQAQKAKGGEGEKRKKKRAKVGGGVGPSEGYRRYVYRVMKQVHPDMGISSKAMTILNNLMGDMFERIANEAAILSKYVGRATLASVDIQDAVKLVLPGELGKHAIAEGAKAVANYVSSVEKYKEKP